MHNSNSQKTVLTEKRVAGLTEVGRYPDARVPGLNFQISKAGGRSWVLRYSLNRTDRMMGLGRADLVNVEAAREGRAKVAWRLILDGIDPVAAKEARQRSEAAAAAVPTSISFTAACDRYIASHQAGWKNGSTGRNGARR